MVNNLKNTKLTSLDDLFKSEEERQAGQQEQVLEVPADQIFPYARQPYTIDRPTPDLVRLMDSVERFGIMEPMVVRPRDGGGYEIIAGHRRNYCAGVVGLETRPVIVREYTDEEADILVVDFNINREDLMPSEKAKAYKLKLDAMKRQGARTDLTSDQVGPKFVGQRSNELLAEQVSESKTQVQRYVRLTKLIPVLLEQVDSGKLKLVPAADYISHLTEKEQTYLALVMERDEVSPSVGQAFLKSYISVCMEGAVIVLACIIFSAFASSGTPAFDPSASVVSQVWSYLGEVIFNMLVLVGLVKTADWIAKEMFGL